jgi:hydrogenase maturation factor
VVLIENMNKEKNIGVLKQVDLELIERVIYKNGDDIAVSIGRSFERIEEKLDDIESRIYSRLEEIEKELGAELLTVRSLVEDKTEVVISEA